MTEWFELLKKQQNVFATYQALACGVSLGAIATRVKRGEWTRIAHGLIAATGPTLTFEQYCHAALLNAGSESRLWGATAARLHGLDGFTPFKPDPGLPIQVAVPHKQRPRSSPLFVAFRTAELDDFATRYDFPCCSAVRALIDASKTAPWRSIVMAFEHLHRQRKYGALAERVHQLREGRQWLARIQDLLHRRGPNAKPTESAAEAVLDDILWRGGLRPDRQLRVRTGSCSFRLDFAFPSLKLGIECDSRQWHTAADAFDRDRERWASLVAQGWRLLHFTWRQLDDEQYVLDTVRAAMRAKAA